MKVLFKVNTTLDYTRTSIEEQMILKLSVEYFIEQ